MASPTDLACDVDQRHLCMTRPSNDDFRRHTSTGRAPCIWKAAWKSKLPMLPFR